MRRTAGLSIALALAMAFAACGRRGVEPAAVADQPEMLADQIIFDAKEWLTKDGVRKALLLADTALLYNDSSTVLHARGLHLTMYDERGTQSGDLTARRGVLDTREQSMTAVGNVVMVLDGGARRIETEELHYDPQGNRIWSDVATTYTHGGDVVHGSGFTSDLDFNNFRVRNPKGRGKGMEITF